MFSLAEQLLFLKQHSLFREMTFQQLEQLTARFEIQCYRPGEVLYREGDMDQRFYILVRGAIRVVKAYGTPTERQLARLQPNDFFGEMGIFEDEPHIATLIADVDSVVFTLSPESLKDLIIQHPTLVLEMGRALSARLRRYTRSETSSDWS